MHFQHNILSCQLLGVAVLGCGIWVLVDNPSFLDLFEKVEFTTKGSCTYYVTTFGGPERPPPTVGEFRG